MTISSEFKDLVIESEGSDFRVSRSAFTDPRILERERETVFARGWLYVGHTSEVPAAGDYLTRTIGAEPLILGRDRDGKIRVFYNACRHRGALVCRDDRGNASTFRCFYHQWTYRNSGELIGVNDKASYPPSFDQEQNGLLSPKFDVYRDLVFATFNDDAESLVDYLGEVRPYLDSIVDQSIDGTMEVVTGSHLYSMGGNWKLIVENSVDGYHAPAVHESYFKFMISRGYDMSGGLQGVGRALGNGHGVLEYSSPVGRSSAREVAPMTDSLKGKIHSLRKALEDKHGPDVARRIADNSKNIFIYPNLIIIDGSSLQLRILDPVTPAYTEVAAWAFAPVGEDEELREHRLVGYLEFLGPGGFATPDDNEAIEACQRGFGHLRGAEWSVLSRGMHKEVAGVNDEEQIRGFWRQWQKDIA